MKLNTKPILVTIMPLSAFKETSRSRFRASCTQPMSFARAYTEEANDAALPSHRRQLRAMPAAPASRKVRNATGHCCKAATRVVHHISDYPITADCATRREHGVLIGDEPIRRRRLDIQTCLVDASIVDLSYAIGRTPTHSAMIWVASTSSFPLKIGSVWSP